MSKTIVCAACQRVVTRCSAQFNEKLGRRICSSCEEKYNEAIALLEVDDDTNNVSKIVAAISSLIKANASVNLTEVGDALKEGSNSFLDCNCLFDNDTRENVRRCEHELIDRAISNFEVFRDRYLEQSEYQFITS